MSKKIRVVLLVIILAVGATLALSYRKQNPSPIPTAPIRTDEIQTAKLIVDSGSGQSLAFTMEVANASGSAFSLLSQTASAENWEISVKQYDFGVFVESLLGKPSTADTAWIYFINGQSGSVAADRQPVRPGDVVEWKYVKPQF